MNSKQIVCTAGNLLAACTGLAAGSYAAYVGVTWLRYGRPARPETGDVDALLDRFMAEYEVVDRHHIRVAAPAEITFGAAKEVELEKCAIVRAIFMTREWIMGSRADHTIRPRGLVAQTQSMGWGILAEVPGREIVVGAVTKPWEANRVFRALQPDEFAAFEEPGYVKIVWTLRVEPVSDRESVLRTETRAAATDRESRRKFRRYWSILSPGIIAIRRVMLPAVKGEAERRGRAIAKRRRTLSQVF